MIIIVAICPLQRLCNTDVYGCYIIDGGMSITGYKRIATTTIFFNINLVFTSPVPNPVVFCATRNLTLQFFLQGIKRPFLCRLWSVSCSTVLPGSVTHIQKVVVMGLTLCHSNKRINQQCTLLFNFFCTVQQVRFHSSVIMDKLSTS